MRFRFVALLLLLGACKAGGDAVRPPDTDPDTTGGLFPGATLEHTKDDGDFQSVVVGTQAGLPLKIRVMRGQTPLAGIFVAWNAEKPGASVSPDTSKTDQYGYATTFYTASTVAGFESITARIPEDTEFFLVQSLGGPPALLVKSPHFDSTPADGIGVGGSVLDPYGNPVDDVPITWSVLSGDGQVEPIYPATTGGGAFQAVVRFGPPPATVVVSASANGLSSVEFTVKRY